MGKKYSERLLPFRTSVYTVYMTIHSWITLSANDPRPLYLQVIEQIKRRVAVGDLPAGAELPSIRQLASDLRVSVITIKRAYLELERDSVIVTRQGKGSFVGEDVQIPRELQDREIRDHLDQAVSIAMMMGKSKAEMQRQIAEAYERARKEKP